MRENIKTYNLCLLGFGNVNRTLLRLLASRDKELRERYGIGWQITGVASRRLGWIAEPGGLDVSELDGLFGAGNLARGKSGRLKDVRDWLQAAKADVLFEATPLNVESGQPAIEHLRAALEYGAHAITANKGPVVFAYEELSSLAGAKGKRFLFESTVMDGVPIFSLFRDSLPTVHLRGFRGILNSTTNVIISGMEEGLSFDHDIDGWDAAVKVAALVTVLMGTRLRPGEVQREGIRNLSGEIVRSACSQGKRYKLVCRARRVDQRIEASVGPELLPVSDPLAQVAGTSSIVYFESDIFPGLVITEHNPGLEATAYGMLADFVRAVSR